MACGNPSELLDPIEGTPRTHGSQGLQETPQCRRILGQAGPFLVFSAKGEPDWRSHHPGLRMPLPEPGAPHHRRAGQRPLAHFEGTHGLHPKVGAPRALAVFSAPVFSRAQPHQIAVEEDQV